MKNKVIDRKLVGKWIASYAFGSSVCFEVKVKLNQYVIKCSNSDDDEIPEIYDVRWDGVKLMFCLYWESTGRFVKEALQRTSDDLIEVTYTYTDMEVYKRVDDQASKKSKKAVRPKRPDAK